jgi:hypothetical protein
MTDMLGLVLLPGPAWHLMWCRESTRTTTYQRWQCSLLQDFVRLAARDSPPLGAIHSTWPVILRTNLTSRLSSKLTCALSLVLDSLACLLGGALLHGFAVVLSVAIPAGCQLGDAHARVKTFETQ